GLKRVFMAPPAIGAADLLIDKPVRRLPGRDHRPPADRKAMQTQPVIDLGSRLNLDGRRSDDVEVQQGGSQRFELKGVAEEGEDVFATAGNPELSLEHPSASILIPGDFHLRRAVVLTRVVHGWGTGFRSPR